MCKTPCKCRRNIRISRYFMTSVFSWKENAEGKKLWYKTE